MSSNLGRHFEAEIREQPAVWERLAASDTAAHLARELDGDVILLGSGSSLFVAQLGALALRRRGVAAHALAATEAHLDHNAYLNRTVVAISQSGRSTDLLDAIDVLQPKKLIALTNSNHSPLAARASVTIDILARPEIAVPASKSVSATAAILLWAASVVAGDGRRDTSMLVDVAHDVRAWLDGRDTGASSIVEVARAAVAIAALDNVVILGSDYGLPIAREAGLKLKEACYFHSEGFAAGEFRHGSVAMVDASCATLGIVDADAFEIVARPLREMASTAGLRYTIGTQTVDGIQHIGPQVDAPFNTLAWLATIQMLALYAARARGIECDRPRGLTKALVGDHL